MIDPSPGQVRRQTLRHGRLDRAYDRMRGRRQEIPIGPEAEQAMRKVTDGLEKLFQRLGPPAADPETSKPSVSGFVAEVLNPRGRRYEHLRLISWRGRKGGIQFGRLIGDDPDSEGRMLVMAGPDGQHGLHSIRSNRIVTRECRPDDLEDQVIVETRVKDEGPRVVQIMCHEVLLPYLKSVLGIRGIEVHRAGEFDGLETYITTPRFDGGQG